MLEALSGKKTYILAGVGAFVTGLWMAGIVSDETANYILSFLGFGSIAALRAGVAKS